MRPYCSRYGKIGNARGIFIGSVVISGIKQYLDNSCGACDVGMVERLVLGFCVEGVG